MIDPGIYVAIGDGPVDHVDQYKQQEIYVQGISGAVEKRPL